MLRFALLLLFVLSPAAAFAYDNGRVPINTPESAKRMIDDLIASFGDRYPKGKEYLQRLDELAPRLGDPQNNPSARQEFEALLRESALANPLLDFDKILLVRRNTRRGFGFINLNAYTAADSPRNGINNELAVLSDLRTTPTLTPIYRHPDGSPIRDIDLHFDGKKVMFSAIEKILHDGKEELRWAIYEIGIDGQNLKKLTPSLHDVDWFDSCYLSEEDSIITASTAGMQGLPCENGGKVMANLYRIDQRNGEPVVRQLTFEQDSDWHPTVMEDGRVMYLRWEYSDIPHYMSRMLFAMQPDGRQQRALWGSGSMFPTAYKNPRQIPGQPNKMIGVASGHHTQGGGYAETGRLIILNTQLGFQYPVRYDPSSKEWGPEGAHLNVFPRVFPKEMTGCEQEIPGCGLDVVGNIYDNQGGAGTYRFAYPYPLNENYFLVSMKHVRRPTFGLYLVDRFDNITQILELPQDSLFFPTPLIARERPPVKPDMTDLNNMEGTMFITDVYLGEGLKGVPRGTIKSLRIFAYHFGFRGSGGHESVGQNSSWDIKRILGTVSVEEDGSASFKVPANTPISIQALDADGRAVQLMRSWTVSMPGEQQSCIGCHESPLDVTPARRTAKAATRPPSEITPWYGPTRSFGYEAEIQPMLEKNCVSCHNDDNKQARNLPSFEAHHTGDWRTDTSYAALNPYAWRPGPEPDPAFLPPMDYHASVSELVQRLQKGHYGIELDAESWDRIHTWIDLNVPYRGMWTNPQYEDRRLELSKLYANLADNPEEEYRQSLAVSNKDKPEKLSPEQLDEVVKRYAVTDTLSLRSFPFDTETAIRMQERAAGQNTKLIVKLGNEAEPSPQLGLPADTSYAWIPSSPPMVGKQPRLVAPATPERIEQGSNRRITFVLIPAGEYIMGQLDGLPDERNRKIVRMGKPFWMAETEITNGQYAVFNPEHDTRYLPEEGKDHIVPGYIANHPDQPVARITFQEAEAFCRWLSEKTGKTVKLPTEAEWEWAARAGTDTPFWYGDRNTDFSKYANLAGEETRFTYTTWESGSTIHIRRPFDEHSMYPLRDNRFSDKWFVVDYVKQYEPNPWGLYDMIGNVWEWTYPDPESVSTGKVVARGGSWKNRPKFAGSSTKVVYEPWQKVMNVGFRPIIMP